MKESKFAVLVLGLGFGMTQAQATAAQPAAPIVPTPGRAPDGASGQRIGAA